MKRAMALASATVAWVFLIQAASMAMAPPVLIELTPVDVSQANLAPADLPLADLPLADLALADPSPSPTTTGAIASTTTMRDGPGLTATTVPVTTPVPAGPAITAPPPVAAPTTTTTRPPVSSATTTTRPPAPAGTTTTTRPPAPIATTTAPVPPTTTAPAPTTTVAPPVTTTAPPATTTTVAPVTTPTAAAVSGGFSAAAESDFISRINGLRSSLGLAGLAGNGALNNYARWWAKQMADSGNFAHSNIGSLLNPWTVVGENIGYGPSVNSIFNALVASPGHYKNMADARFTSVGAGAYLDSSGRLWTAHVFGA